MTVGQRFARVVTSLAVRSPATWRLFRAPMAHMFDRIAPEWEGRRTAAIRLAPALAALDALPAPPARVLDVGTGTGALARAVAARFPEAEVVGIDVSGGMIDVARSLAGSRERYETGDASALPYVDGSFELVTLNNMIPFFDELARVTAPGGHVLVAYALGPQTPIWVPLERVRAQLERRGFAHVGDFAAGDGVSLLATRR
jgi:malonyl-CoA O-methyltransferase